MAYPDAMLIAEDLLLLLTDDETGKLKGSYAEIAVGGALLLDLTLSGRVRITEDGETNFKRNQVIVEDQSPTDNPVLDQALERIKPKTPCKPQRAVELLKSGFVKPLYERLAAAGVLHEEHKHLLGLIPQTTWPTNDPAHEREVRGALAATLVDGREADVRIACLASLLSALDMAHKVVAQDVPGVNKGAVKKRAKELRKENWVSTAAYKAIEAVEASYIAIAAAAGAAGSSS